MKNWIVFLFMVVLGTSSVAQNLNDYKYVIVPKQYEWSRERNQYRINELTVFLFEKYGFTAVMEGDSYPLDLKNNLCSALKADVTENSSMLLTRLQVTLSDCDSNLLYTSEPGKSKEKEYKRAYYEALRGAFESVKELNYTYSGDASPTLKEEKPVTATSNPQPQEVEDSEAVEELQKTENENTVLSPVQGQLDNSNTAMYASSKSSYNVKRVDKTFTIYDGKDEIGVAKQAVGNTFLVKTSHFEGVGVLQEDRFILSFEVKGQGDLKEIVLYKL